MSESSIASSRNGEPAPYIDGATLTLNYCEETGALSPWRDKFAQQAILELEMGQIAQERAWRARGDVLQRRAECETGYGQRLVEAEIAPLAKAIESYVGGACLSGPGRKPEAAKRLQSVDPVRAALWTLRVIVDGVSVETPLSRAALEVGTLIEDEVRLAELRAKDRAAARRLTEAVSRGARRRLRKAILQRASGPEGADARWSARERELVGLKLIDLALSVSARFEAKSVRIGNERTEWRVAATSQARADIRAMAELSTGLRPTYAPMIAPPRPYSDAASGGYLTTGVRPLRLHKPHPSGRRAPKISPATAPIVFLAANAAQDTPWRVNQRVFETMRRALGGGPAACVLPSASARDEPGVDIEADVEGAELWKLRAEWSAEEKARRARRFAVERAHAEARRFSAFDKIYFPVQYDFRGRMYAVPAFNPQGPDNMRALLEFARGKPLGDDGWKWLAIHLCNQGDFEKMSKAPLGERVGWTLENEERILAVAADPEADLFWTEADNPWQFLAACFEWAGYRAEGDGFVSHLPVALDGACSGLQHFSLALRDEVGGAAVNLAPGVTEAADIYEEVALQVRMLLKDDVLRGAKSGADEAERKRGELAAQWLAFGVDRKLCKRPTMTYGYGARSYGYAEQITKDVLEPSFEEHRAGKRNWPFEARGFQAATYMASRLTEAIERTVVKAAEAMRWLQACASVASEDGIGLEWRAPDGFVVRQDYRQTRAQRIRAALAGKSVRMTLREPVDALDKRRQRQGVAPNFVHALDGCHLRLTVARAWEEGMRDFALIHDSFGVHAADTPRFFQLVRETMIEMYGEFDVIGDFASALSERLSDPRRGELPPPPPPGALALSGVLESEFCFS